MDKKYYIYVYYREDKTTPYYIGKGCEGRITGQHEVKVPDEEYREKLYENLWEDEAYFIESELINKYGRIGIDKGGILKNKASGRYSMEEIAEEYKEQERRIIEEEEDKERFKEYYQELEDYWQKEMYNLRLIRDNNPDRFIEHLINYEYFDEDGREQLELVCKELLV